MLPVATLSVIPEIVNFSIFPSPACNTSNPLVGTPLDPLTNCNNLAFISRSKSFVTTLVEVLEDAEEE